MSDTKMIETDDFRTRIAPGKYIAKTEATIFLTYGTGEGRRDISYQSIEVGQTIEIPQTVGGHWYGLEPNGDFLSPEPAIIESAS